MVSQHNRLLLGPSHKIKMTSTFLLEICPPPLKKFLGTLRVRVCFTSFIPAPANPRKRSFRKNLISFPGKLNLQSIILRINHTRTASLQNRVSQIITLASSGNTREDSQQDRLDYSFSGPSCPKFSQEIATLILWEHVHKLL